MWSLVPDGLQVVPKLLLWFQAKPSSGVGREHSPKTRNYPVSGSCAENVGWTSGGQRSAWADMVGNFERQFIKTPLRLALGIFFLIIVCLLIKVTNFPESGMCNDEHKLKIC